MHPHDIKIMIAIIAFLALIIDYSLHFSTFEEETIEEEDTFFSVEDDYNSIDLEMTELENEIEFSTEESLIDTEIFFEFEDKRDGTVYRTKRIGGQEWMTEDLKYKAKGSKTGDGDFVFYNWQAATTACPDGWHLPTKEEWFELIKWYDQLAKKEWEVSNLAAWDLIANGESFLNIGVNDDTTKENPYASDKGFYWTATAYNKDKAWYYLFNKTGTINSFYTPKKYYSSCRCMKDSE